MSDKKAVKYPEAIFGVLSSMITDDLKLGHGFEHNPHIFDRFCELANEMFVMARRETLEAMLGIHQILPYLLIIEEQGDVLDLCFKLHNYQRVKGDGSGEVRLLGAHSIGAGGHPDGNEILKHRGFVDKSIIDIKEIILDCARRELGEECKFWYDGKAYEPGRSDFRFLGLLIDNTPATTAQIRKGEIPVGQLHVGVVMALVVRKGTEIFGGESKMKFFAPASTGELLASGRSWEPWSQMLLETLDKHDLKSMWLQDSNEGGE